MSEDDSDSNRARIDANVRRTVGIAALRKIRKLVDESDAEKHIEHKAMIAAVVMLVVLLAFGVYLALHASNFYKS